MKKLLALLLALLLCASAALAEDGMFDYTVFEENEEIDFEIDHFDDEWTAGVALLSTIVDVPMVFGVTGTLDGGISMVALAISEPCEEVKVQVDDTVYTFDTALQVILLDTSGVGLMLTPETEPFFQTLATAEEVNVRVTLDGEENGTDITGSDLEKMQLVLAELFAQDVMNCYTEDGEAMWDAAGLIQTMTVD